MLINKVGLELDIIHSCKSYLLLFFYTLFRCVMIALIITKGSYEILGYVEHLFYFHNGHYHLKTY